MFVVGGLTPKSQIRANVFQDCHPRAWYEKSTRIINQRVWTIPQPGAEARQRHVDEMTTASQGGVRSQWIQ